VEDIVQYVLRKLHCKYPSESKGLVGIDKHYAHLESFMRIRSKEVGMIGIKMTKKFVIFSLLKLRCF